MATDTTNMASLVPQHTLPKLDGASNYRRSARDMEMILVRMDAWHLVSHPPPPALERDAAWTRKNDWARSEIHLSCSPEQQDLIEDSTTAYDSWTILHHEYNHTIEQKVKRLQKEFASITMTEDDCSTYIHRAKRLLSDLKSCGVRIKDADVAYAILVGLPEKFASLVTTLTNMTTPEKPLEVMRVSDQILEEEQRLMHFASQKPKPDPNVVNPLAFKGDTTFKGQHAYVARGNPVSYRCSPYNSRSFRGDYSYTAGRGIAPGHRGAYTPRPLYGNENLPVAPLPSPAVPRPALVKQENNTNPGAALARNLQRLPWQAAPWQPRIPPRLLWKRNNATIVECGVMFEKIVTKNTRNFILRTVLGLMNNLLILINLLLKVRCRLKRKRQMSWHEKQSWLMNPSAVITLLNLIWLWKHRFCSMIMGWVLSVRTVILLVRILG